MTDQDFDKLLESWSSRMRLTAADSCRMLEAVLEPSQDEPFTGAAGEQWLAFWQTIGALVYFGQRYGSWSLEQTGLFGGRRTAA